jgi:hypothetical protein
MVLAVHRVRRPRATAGTGLDGLAPRIAAGLSECRKLDSVAGHPFKPNLICFSISMIAKGRSDGANQKTVRQLRPSRRTATAREFAPALVAARRVPALVLEPEPST